MSRKLITISVACFVIAVIASCSTAKESGGVQFSFDASECSKSESREVAPGLGKSEWINDGSLVITATAYINCSCDIIEKGDYKIDGNRIELFYTLLRYKDRACSRCVCPAQMSFKFKGLKKMDFTFDLKELK